MDQLKFHFDYIIDELKFSFDDNFIDECVQL